MSRPLVRFLAGASILAGISCGGSDGTISPPPRVLTTVSVTVTPTSVLQGQTATATATGTDQNGAAMPLATINWSSSNPNVATVTSTGSVNAVGAGTTQIVATSGGRPAKPHSRLRPTASRPYA